MKEQLRELKDHDHGCVITVRKIQYLGFSAATVLKDYFESFGSVQSVLVPQSHVRSCYLPSGQKKRQATIRQRPAHLGFIVMQNTASAQAALAEGSEHNVGGVSILLEPFDEARWNVNVDATQEA